MRTIPKIGTVGKVSDFHDSSLVAFEYLPLQGTARVILSTPNEFDTQELWLVQLCGVLEIELQTVGDGEVYPLVYLPEIYDVYDAPDSLCGKRWKRRLEALGLKEPHIHVVTFASSYLRGWDNNEDLEGIRITCREVTVDYAPPSEESKRERS